MDGIVNVGKSMLEKTRWYRELGLETTAYKRLLQIECKKNLSLIDLLKLESAAADSNALIAVAARLQYDAIEYLLSGDDLASKVESELSDVDFISIAEVNQDSDTNHDRHEPHTTVFDKIRLLYVRMYAVKTCAEVVASQPNLELDGLKKINYKTRLKNIRKVLFALDQNLEASISKS